jgi:hypothetical protein
VGGHGRFAFEESGGGTRDDGEERIGRKEKSSTS